MRVGLLLLGPLRAGLIGVVPAPPPDRGSLDHAASSLAQPATPPPAPVSSPASQPAADDPTASSPPAGAPTRAPAGAPTSVPAGASTSAPATPPASERPGIGLPVTGAQVGGMVLLGTGLLAGGFAMLAVRRRRLPSDVMYGTDHSTDHS